MSAEAASSSFPQAKPLLRGLPFRQSREASRPEEPVAADAASQDLDKLLRPSRWTPGPKADPELRKVFGAIRANLSETRRLLVADTGRFTLRNEATENELAAVLGHEPEALVLDTAWELAGNLKRLNLRLGDEFYVAAQLEYERQRAAQAGKWHSWNTQFQRRELDQLAKAYASGAATIDQHKVAVERLTSLYLSREESGRDRGARAGLKAKLLNDLVLPFFGLLIALGVAVNYAAEGSFLPTMIMAACAGALGSMLSGVFKVRDQLVRLDELRGFIPAMRVQPFIGASAGLILWLVLDSKVIEVSSGSSATWSGIGLLAFVAGFSEPFFLGIVQRVAHVPDQAGDAKAK
jgi:hypothetical protein